jgi:hypothetical protein
VIAHAKRRCDQPRRCAAAASTTDSGTFCVGGSLT